jgi:hypothetical protein
MRPLSGRLTPAAIFASVDLPAPFAPISATTSPRPIARSTSSSACVAPNHFDTEISESAGATAKDKSSIEARKRGPERPQRPTYGAVLSGPKSLIRSTYYCGRCLGLGLAQAEWIERMVDEARTRLRQLTEWGYAFARNDRGEIYRGSLGGPNYMQLLRRRPHKAGGSTSRSQPRLQASSEPGGGRRAKGLTRAGAPWTVQSSAVVLATAGAPL